MHKVGGICDENARAMEICQTDKGWGSVPGRRTASSHSFNQQIGTEHLAGTRQSIQDTMMNKAYRLLFTQRASVFREPHTH